jgi:hypothetical protein
MHLFEIILHVFMYLNNHFLSLKKNLVVEKHKQVVDLTKLKVWATLRNTIKF